MSERKVLNKYYPPDFDPSKIPRVKGSSNRVFTVRLMAPANMKCYTCGEYIAKGKKFNARKEDVDDMNYHGLRIYRFYIKCPGCLSEISFRTDPVSQDYVIEAGAHRNFQALKLAEEQAEREAQEAQEEIESNPMLLLENRTQQSQYEMELLESLEDLRELNDRNAVIDLSKIAGTFHKEKQLTAEQIDEADRLEALKILGYEMVHGKMVKRIKVAGDCDDQSLIKKAKSELTDDNSAAIKKNQYSLKAKLNGLVRKKVKILDKEDIDRKKMPPPSAFVSITSNSKNPIPSIAASSTVSNGNVNGSSCKDSASPQASNSSSPVPVSSGLGLLGSYSDSESDED